LAQGTGSILHCIALVPNLCSPVHGERSWHVVTAEGTGRAQVWRPLGALLMAAFILMLCSLGLGSPRLAALHGRDSMLTLVRLPWRLERRIRMPFIAMVWRKGIQAWCRPLLLLCCSVLFDALGCICWWLDRHRGPREAVDWLLAVLIFAVVLYWAWGKLLFVAALCLVACMLHEGRWACCFSAFVGGSAWVSQLVLAYAAFHIHVPLDGCLSTLAHAVRCSGIVLLLLSAASSSARTGLRGGGGVNKKRYVSESRLCCLTTGSQITRG